MTPPPLAQQERLALCDLFVERGADAPTLCEGWNTADLAAHPARKCSFKQRGAPLQLVRIIVSRRITQQIKTEALLVTTGATADCCRIASDCFETFILSIPWMITDRPRRGLLTDGYLLGKDTARTAG